MKLGWKNKLAIAVCSACLVMPLSVSANMSVLDKKGLYEMRTLSGQFQPGFSDGNLNNAKHAAPISLLELKGGGLLVSDSDNHTLRLVQDENVSSYSGLVLDFDNQGFAIGAYQDGTKESAFYDRPAGLAEDAAGNIFVADSNNHAIRKITPAGVVTTIGGTGVQGYKDGEIGSSQFHLPSDVAVDAQGNVYVADTLNHVIRKIDTSGKVTTLNKRSERLVEYFPGMVTEAGDYKDGPLESALFNEPSSLAIDARGNLYVSDTGNQRIRYIDFAANTVKTVAGGGGLEGNALYVEGAFADGAASEARFSNPLGISIAADGSLLIADSNNHVIRLLAEGKVYTLAGQPEQDGRPDGVMTAAQLSQPSDVIERSDGTIVIADSRNNKVRVIQRYEGPQHNEDGQLHVIVNGALLQSDVPPQLVKGRTYVPLRALAENLGYEVTYNAITRESSIIVNDELAYTFSNGGAKVVKVTSNGEEILDAASLTINKRLVVPVRFVSEQLGFDVQWDSSNKHVVVRSVIFND